MSSSAAMPMTTATVERRRMEMPIVVRPPDATRPAMYRY
jgi:hypothetical protein